MVLEATMTRVDNSEWMCNGDYSPTRFQAQADAVNLISGTKTQSNPENTVGVLTIAGKGVCVLVTPTSDLGKILACMHGLDIGGEMNLAAGIQIAQLALKHRQNKEHQQRIIMFAGGYVFSCGHLKLTMGGYVDISESEVEVKHAISDVSDNIPFNVSYKLSFSAKRISIFN